MSIYRINPELLKSNGASDGDVLTYVSANARIEWSASTGGGGDVANAWVNANDYATLLAAYSNDYSTLLAAQSNDYATLLSAQSNDYSTFLAVEANIFNTYTALSANSDVANAWVNANDYATYSILSANINSVNSNLDSVATNLYNTYNTLTANDYNTYQVLRSNLITAVEEDSSPILGGNLTLNSYSIVGSGDITISGALTADSANLSNFTISDTLTIGSQIIYAQGTNGFSVNEDFDPSNNALQTAYHFTSGAGRETVAFTLARTAQFTDGFGIYGTSANNTLVMFGEQTNTNFEWRKGIGIRPLDLDGGSLLMRLTNGGDLTVLGNLTSASLSNAWVNANDYATLLEARSNDYSTLLEARSNDYATLLEARSNDYSTYTSLQANIDTVQSNLASASSNTQIYVGDTLLSNTSVRITAGDGVAFTTNANASEVSFAVAMSNVTSQTFALSGSTNVFTIAKTANVNMVFVIYNGLVQDPSRYSISSTTLTLANTEPLVEGANLEVRFLDFFDLPGSSSEGGGSSGPVSGYTSGFGEPSTGIDKFPFATDGNATDVGDLTVARYGPAGQSSSSSGYTSGGFAPPFVNTIDKFPFAADGNATDVGDLTVSRSSSPAGQSSNESGYTSGGATASFLNTIDKFPFSADANATDVGDLTQTRSSPAGQSSTSSGYSSGGFAPGRVNTIDKFPFSSDGNATDVGDLTVVRNGVTGQSSSTSGYTSGGYIPGFTNIIDKFPFASNANASDVGDLTVARQTPAGQSSSSSGYTSGGGVPSSVNTIDKFPFASDSNASDVGDLTVADDSIAGQQG